MIQQSVRVAPSVKVTNRVVPVAWANPALKRTGTFIVIPPVEPAPLTVA